MKHFLPALTFVLREFLKILLVPYNLYCKSIERLIETKKVRRYLSKKFQQLAIFIFSKETPIGVSS